MPCLMTQKMLLKNKLFKKKKRISFSVHFWTKSNLVCCSKQLGFISPMLLPLSAIYFKPNIPQYLEHISAAQSDLHFMQRMVAHMIKGV